MKQRFSSLDVKVIAHELSRSLTSLRLSNVYDLSSRIFLLKFAKPNTRQQLLIDTGFRCHLTDFSRTTAAAPSAFVARLRKFLRTRRVTSVSQIGTDRVIEIVFSDGQYRLFLEFFAAGNIVLTDEDLKVLGLFRNVFDGPEEEHLRPGFTYKLDHRQNFEGTPELTEERVRNALQTAIEKRSSGTATQGKKSKKISRDELRKALSSSLTEFPPMLVEHAFRVKAFDPTLKPNDVLGNPDLFKDLMGVLQEAQSVLESITNSDSSKGYIIAKSNGPTSSDDSPEQAQNLLYDDYHPFKPKQFEDDADVTILEFENFNKTVDEFYSSIEGQKLQSRLQDREDNAKRKLDAAKTDHEKRLEGLQAVQQLNIRKAEAIEANLQWVEEATAAVNGLIAQGMDWVDIGKLIESEQKKHNSVAEIIKLPLKLQENTITLLLGETDFNDEGYDDFEGDETDEDVSDSELESTKAPVKVEEKRLAIDVDLGISPWANARQYYDQKKTAAEKEQRTVQSSTKALKAQEKRIQSALQKGLKQEKAVLRPVRKQMWFEKFLYFVSSDGYLVLGGKDAQQNEILYRRYLRKGDIYVHADLNGAASVIIKNNPSTPDAPIPPSTLSQAGNFSISTSSAWESKAVMSAWWVTSDQVSKTAPTGEYLVTGSFTIRGKKNFLPPSQLLLGFGVMFQISDESKASHVKHRIHNAEPTAEVLEVEDKLEDLDMDEKAQGHEGNDAAGENDTSSSSSDPESEDGHDQDKESEPFNPLQSPISSRPRMKDSPDEKSEVKAAQNIDSEPEDSEPSDTQSNSNEISVDTTNAVRHLSARERRLMRKGIDPNSGPGIPLEPDDGNSPEPSIKPQNSKGSSPVPQVRGKRGRKKKMASKYADQDEEDRELAMKLLGSHAAKEKVEEEEKAKRAKEEEKEFQKQRRKAQHEKAAMAAREHEEARRLMREENIEVLDEEEQHSMTLLDSLVGTPLPGDEILEAIPVCAPWSAMGKYKYKVKLQPGSQKKGKAVKEILGKWISAGSEKKNVDEKSEDKERIWPREIELIKGWKDTEVINSVPVGKVRVMMSGGTSGATAKTTQAKNKGRGGKGSKKR